MKENKYVHENENSKICRKEFNIDSKKRSGKFITYEITIGEPYNSFFFVIGILNDSFEGGVYSPACRYVNMKNHKFPGIGKIEEIKKYLNNPPSDLQENFKKELQDINETLFLKKKDRVVYFNMFEQNE